MSVTKTFLLEGLCCANCAAAIEREVATVSGVESAIVNLDDTTITVVFIADELLMFQTVASIASEIDEDIITKII